MLLHVASNVGAFRFDPILSLVMCVKHEPFEATMFDGNVHLHKSDWSFSQPIEGRSDRHRAADRTTMPFQQLKPPTGLIENSGSRPPFVHRT